MSSPRSPALAGAALLPLCALVACGGGGGESARLQTTPFAAAALPADLDGRDVRHVGLVRFEVVRNDHGSLEFAIDDETTYTAPVGDRTSAEAAFTTLDAPLDDAVLARVAAMPNATGRCYPIESPEARSVGTLFDSLGTPAFAGDTITVSNAAGSWFELQGYEDDPFYVQSHDSMPYVDFGFLSGVEGAVEAGTTLDVSGAAFPAFAAVEAPPLGSLTGVVENGTEVRWSAGPDPAVPIVIDVRFDDYVEIVWGSEDVDGALTDDDYPYLTDEDYPKGGDIRTLVEAPMDMRCVTRDTGRFTYPDALRQTMETFRAAGERAAERLAGGSDVDPAPRSGIDPDASLTDEDIVEVAQGRRVGVSRIATRYRVEGDALLIVQSSTGGTL